MHINVFKYTEIVWKEPNFTKNEDNDNNKNNDNPYRACTM